MLCPENHVIMRLWCVMKFLPALFDLQVKCEPYWPNEIHEPKQYGEVVVDPVSISTLGKYNITIFNVSVVSII